MKTDRFNQYHEGIGGIQWRENCCSSESVAFHYVSPALMYHIERRLYYCRSVADNLNAYNEANEIDISYRIIDVPSIHDI